MYLGYNESPYILFPVCIYGIMKVLTSSSQFFYTDVSGQPVRVVQLNFLKLLSATAHQTFTYLCQNSAGWYDSTTRGYGHALRFRGSGGEELTQETCDEASTTPTSCSIPDAALNCSEVRDRASCRS